MKDINIVRKGFAAWTWIVGIALVVIVIGWMTLDREPWDDGIDTTAVAPADGTAREMPRVDTASMPLPSALRAVDAGMFHSAITSST